MPYRRVGWSWPAETGDVPVDNEEALSGFVQGSLAACADLHPLGLAILVDGNPLDVWFPLALGLDIGVANIVPKGRGFATYLAFCHDRISPIQTEPACTRAGPAWSGSLDAILPQGRLDRKPDQGWGTIDRICLKQWCGWRVAQAVCTASRAVALNQ